MKLILRTVVFMILVLISINVFAQKNFTISGIVVDEKGVPLKSATVFISDSKIITVTNDEGKFTLFDLEPGSFRLSVTTVGYAAYNQSVIIRDKPVDLRVTLKIKPIILNEVVIGKVKNWDDYYKLFKESFLGTTYNGDQCVIVNPKVLDFSTNKNVLTAYADEFLIIENNSLGYRIRYLLKDFKRNMFTGLTSYDGDTNYEELQGTEEQKKEWASNRLIAYQGSLMHYLRSVYANTALKEGFITHQVFRKDGGAYNASSLYIERNVLDLKTITTVLDSSFVSLAFVSIYVVFAPKKAAALQAQQVTQTKDGLADGKSSVLKLYLNEAIIDSKGSFADYRSFLIQGYWSNKRVGDQLPFEYKPTSPD
jgi:hypothetical protein